MIVDGREFYESSASSSSSDPGPGDVHALTLGLYPLAGRCAPLPTRIFRVTGDGALYPLVISTTPC